MRRWPLFFLALLSALPARAAGKTLEGTAIVRGVIDGDTLLLDTGAVVRLAGIQAPELGGGRTL